MIDTTPHLIVGPFSPDSAAMALRAATDKFGPVSSELAKGANDRTWLLLHWSRKPDADTMLKVLGFCHGVAWMKENAQPC